MEGWNYKEYLNKQINKIKELKEKGYTDREIIDKNEFCYEALEYCNLPISYLVPKSEGQEMNLQEWNTHTSTEHKWEYIEHPFGSKDERDKILIGLLYTCGFKHLLEILSEEAIKELDECMIKRAENSNSKDCEWDNIRAMFIDAINKKGLTNVEVKNMVETIEKELKDTRIEKNK